MRRSPWFRALAVLLGVWLPLFIGEPNLLSPCPTHGAYAVTHASAGMAHHHGHDMVVGHGTTGTSQPAPEHSEKDCSCIGCCAPGIAQIAVANAPVAIVEVAAYEPQAEFPPADTHPQPAPELSRPYPT